jgi:hypothetical protein
MQVGLDRWLGAFGEGLDVSFSAQNVFNSSPPFVRLSAIPLGFDATNANPDGRLLSVELFKRW